VEGGVRWFLGAGRRQSSENQYTQGSKRRKVGGSGEKGDLEMDDEERGGRSGRHTRNASQASFADSLPAYEESGGSPDYALHQGSGSALVPTSTASGKQVAGSSSQGASQNQNWQTRLMLSTSGLGVAMSEESLKSLKYCLVWLRWANNHIGSIVIALKDLLQQWEESNSSSGGAPITNSENGIGGSERVDLNGQDIVRHNKNAEINAKILRAKNDVLTTLKKVVDIVSTYAGGALPENARLLVRRHLTSLPHRFQNASTATTPSGDLAHPNGDQSELVGSAQRVLVLAKEGLDMMAQVSGVVDGTVERAEEWIDRLGRRNRGEPEEVTREREYKEGDFRIPTSNGGGEKEAWAFGS
jgi:transcriptional repressor OPI1